MTAEEKALLPTIRTGVFGVSKGFLIIRLCHAQEALVANPDAKMCPRFHMPIIACGWVNSGYTPAFHSLN